ncbi:MAG: GspH/FimT family pseudopilin [candidate division WOR-3 bacterium]
MIRNPSGITLVELVVVIGIMTILLSLATIAFNNYQVKYNIENEIKTLYSDIMGARMRAMNENRTYVVKFTSATSYVTAIDNNGDGDFNAGDTKVDKYSKTALKYNLVWGFPGGTNRITLDNRGLVNVNGNIRIDKTSDSEYDCIAISNTRIKMGKWDGTNCNPR